MAASMSRSLKLFQSRIGINLCSCNAYSNPCRSSRRTLLSASNLGMEHYLRQRIFKSDEMGPSGRDLLLNKLKSVTAAADLTRVAFDITDLIHVAKSQAELDELERLVLLISDSPVTDVSSFRFGASLMRLYHHLNIPDRAYGMYKDKACGDLLRDNTCHKVLMDLLFKNGRYDRVLRVYDTLTFFNIDCVTLVLGSYFHINTPASARASTSLVRRLLRSHTVSQRGLHYTAMLCLNQNVPEDVRECLQRCRGSNLTTNLQLLCAARQKKVDDIRKTLQDAKSRSDNTSRPFNTRLYAETVEETRTCVLSAGSETQRGEYSRLLGQLSANGAISSQTVSSLLDRALPDDATFAKSRGKRSHIT